MNYEDLNNPNTTNRRKKIIQRKFFLKNVYREFYKTIYSSLFLSNKKGYIVELGSGAGFIKKIIPNVITSDILKLTKINMQFSATKMPFKNRSINAFVMIDVFHHINDAGLFLKEADRCLKNGGQIIMIEPASTILGRLIYKYFHHERYDGKAKWSFISNGPLSDSNSALPWIVFYRDRKKFEQKFPNLKILKITPHTPIKYLISGGFTFPQLLPDLLYPAISSFELLLKPINSIVGMFYTITIVKIK